MGRPVRRVLSGGRSPVDGHLSRRHVAVPLQRPTRGLGGPRRHPLSGLAPGEVYPADRVTAIPVVSYTTLSPLPPGLAARRRSALCGTVSRITPGGCYPPPCPVEPGRSSARHGGPCATRSSNRPIRSSESTRSAGHESETRLGEPRYSSRTSGTLITDGSFWGGSALRAFGEAVACANSCFPQL